MKGNKNNGTRRRPVQQAAKLRPGPGQPRRGRIAGPAKKRVTIYLLPEIYSAVCDEANARNVSLGDLVTEAFHTRLLLVAK